MAILLAKKIAAVPYTIIVACFARRSIVACARAIDLRYANGEPSRGARRERSK